MYLYVNPNTGIFTCDAKGPIQYNSAAYADQNSGSIIDGIIPTAPTGSGNSNATSNLASNPGLQNSLQSNGNLAAYQADGTLVDTNAINSSGQMVDYLPNTPQFLPFANQKNLEPTMQ